MSLPDRKLDLVHPHVVIGHAAVAIHLKCDIELAHSRGPRPVIAIHRLPIGIHGHRDEVGMAVGGALEFPHQVMPDIGGQAGASDARILPVEIVVPDPPMLDALEVALRAEDVFVSAHRLVCIELQGLRGGCVF